MDVGLGVCALGGTHPSELVIFCLTDIETLTYVETGEIMTKRKKKTISAREMMERRMTANDGCEANSVETRQSRRAAVRKEKLASVTNQYNSILRHFRRGMVLLPVRDRSHLKGPRGARLIKQLVARPTGFYQQVPSGTYVTIAEKTF